MNMKKTVGLLLSGGLDSAILLGHLLDTGHRVQPFYIRSHLSWEKVELKWARRFLTAMAGPRLADLVTLEMPLRDVYEDHWSLTGRAVPDDASPDTSVYLPGRNPLLLVKASVWCASHDVEQLALAVLGTNPFGDATPEFFAEFQSALSRAMGKEVRLLRPFDHLTKRQVMELGRGMPLELTFSCIAPVDDLHCGVCNKCAERIDAFRAIGADDPTRYARSKQTTKH